jgi:hypothetical protein
MRRLVFLALLVGALAVGLFLMPGVGAADPDLNDVAAHRHFLVVGSGASLKYLAQVGPDVCDHPDLQSAFNEFHNNLHVATPGDAIGPAAPGLHNTRGAEIVPRGCDFQPPA